MLWALSLPLRCLHCGKAPSHDGPRSPPLWRGPAPEERDFCSSSLANNSLPGGAPLLHPITGSLPSRDHFGGLEEGLANGRHAVQELVKGHNAGVIPHKDGRQFVEMMTKGTQKISIVPPPQEGQEMRSAAQLERRRFERAPITAQVEYELTNASSGPGRVRRHLANISSGGMFINTDEPLKAGTRMVVRFELPNKHRVIAVSRVCYARKGRGLGVEFLNLDEEDRDEIVAYIQALRSA